MQVLKINKKPVALLALVGVLLLYLSNIALSQTAVLQRSLQISDPRINQTNVNYILGFDITAPGFVLGSVSLRFCENSPLIALPCDPISGFDASAASVISESGVTGFSIAPGATASDLLITRTASYENPAQVRIELDGITNPSNIGTNYGRIELFPTEDGSGPAIQEGGVTFVTINPVGISTEVPPYLTLCVALSLPGYLCNGASGNFIDFGEFSTSQTRTGTSQFLVATNADFGFVVYLTGKPPTSGNNIINPIATSSSSNVGVSQFGINLRNNSNPNVGSDPVGLGSGVIQSGYNTVNQFKFASGDALVSSNTVTLDRKFTVSYIVNVNGNQSPGVYNTTLLYVALATF